MKMYQVRVMTAETRVVIMRLEKTIDFNQAKEMHDNILKTLGSDVVTTDIIAITERVVWPKESGE